MSEGSRRDRQSDVPSLMRRFSDRLMIFVIFGCSSCFSMGIDVFPTSFYTSSVDIQRLIRILLLLLLLFLFCISFSFRPVTNEKKGNDKRNGKHQNATQLRWRREEIEVTTKTQIRSDPLLFIRQKTSIALISRQPVRFGERRSPTPTELLEVCIPHSNHHDQWYEQSVGQRRFLIRIAGHCTGKELVFRTSVVFNTALT